MSEIRAGGTGVGRVRVKEVLTSCLGALLPSVNAHPCTGQARWAVRYGARPLDVGQPDLHLPQVGERHSRAHAQFGADLGNNASGRQSVDRAVWGR